jgi:SAM-dependent methyltransferase
MTSSDSGSTATVSDEVSDGETGPAYDDMWPEAERIRMVAVRCGAPARPRSARDHLGFDLLNGGLREVWAVGDALGLCADSHALEIGCGLGGPARFLADRHACRVTGIDVSSRQLEIARRLTADMDVEARVAFVRADAERPGFPSETFTHAYSIEAFVHVPDKPRAVAEVFRLLRPGGRLCIHDPIHDPSLRIAMLEGALYPIPVDSYRETLAAAGFVGTTVADRTAASRERYATFANLLAEGPLTPHAALATLHRVHGLSPGSWRLAAPGRLSHVIRYTRDRRQLALDLLGTRERVAGVRQMCLDIVRGYDEGTIRFCQIRADKPDGQVVAQRRSKRGYEGGQRSLTQESASV